MSDILKTQRLVSFRHVNNDGTVGEQDHVLFRYCTAMPWAVAMIQRDNQCTVEQLVDRDILTRGCDIPTGDGDVHVHYVDADDYPFLGEDERCVEIVLYQHDPAARRRLLFTLDDVLDFLDETWQLVEAGCEDEFFEIPDDVIACVETAGDW